MYEDRDGRLWVTGSVRHMYGRRLPREDKKVRYRGYRRQRYRYSRSTKNVAGRTVVSRRYGEIEDDVRRLFFALDSFKLMLVFNDYERKFGAGKRKYAEATLAKWRCGTVQMGGEISERLIRIVPSFLSFEE